MAISSFTKRQKSLQILLKWIGSKLDFIKYCKVCVDFSKTGSEMCYFLNIHKRTKMAKLFHSWQTVSKGEMTTLLSSPIMFCSCRGEDHWQWPLVVANKQTKNEEGSLQNLDPTTLFKISFVYWVAGRVIDHSIICPFKQSNETDISPCFCFQVLFLSVLSSFLQLKVSFVLFSSRNSLYTSLTNWYQKIWTVFVMLL